MKSEIAGLLILTLIMGSTQAGNIFETGFLRDETGYQDGNGSKVAFITPMMGWKDPVTGKTKWTWQAIVIDIPIETNDIRKLKHSPQTVASWSLARSLLTGKETNL